MQAHGRIWQELTWSWAYSTGHPASDRRLEAEEFVHRRDREDFSSRRSIRGQDPARSHLRPSCGVYAGPARHQDISQYGGTQSGEMSERDAGRGRKDDQICRTLCRVTLRRRMCRETIWNVPRLVSKTIKVLKMTPFSLKRHELAPVSRQSVLAGWVIDSRTRSSAFNRSICSGIASSSSFLLILRIKAAADSRPME